MSKEKAPAFQFYPKDFLTDDKVLEMRAEVKGYYITLLSIDWLNDGFRKSSILQLCSFEWLKDDGTLRSDAKEIEAQLLKCFVFHPTKDGFITNPRLQEERDKQAEHRAERAKAGKLGAASKRGSKTQANEQQNDSKTQANEQQNESSSSSSSSSNNSNTLNAADVPVDWVSNLLDDIALEQAQIKYLSAGLEPPDFEHGKARTNRHLDSHPEQRTRNAAFSALSTFGMSEAMKFAADRQRLVKNKGSPGKPTQQAVLDKNKAKLMQLRKEAEDEKRKGNQGGNTGIIDADLLRVE